MPCVLGIAVVWSAIWLIDGVLHLVGATRVADDLFPGSGAADSIVYWTGYWWTYLASRSVLWGVPIMVLLPIASLWNSSMQLRLTNGVRPVVVENSISAEEVHHP